MGCCECLVSDKDCIQTLDLKNDLEIVEKSIDSSFSVKNFKASEAKTAVDLTHQSKRFTPSDLKVIIMKLPDNSNDISIASWKIDQSP